ncbi:MAG: phage holin family protein [Pseudomonadota bacterium]
MFEFIVHIIVSSFLLLVVADILKGIDIKNLKSAIILALVLGLANAIIKPVLIFLTIPITIITLGLFLLVINAFCFYVCAKLVDGVEIRGFLSALLGSILLSILNSLISWLF